MFVDLRFILMSRSCLFSESRNSTIAKRHRKITNSYQIFNHIFQVWPFSNEKSGDECYTIELELGVQQFYVLPY